MIQSLFEYYSLVRNRVFDHLTSLYARKLQAQSAYSRLLSKLSQEAAIRISEIQHFAAGRPHFRSALAAYAQVYQAVKDELKGEAREVDRVGQEREQEYLEVLEKCRISHLQSQRAVIEAARQKLREEADKMGKLVRDLQSRQGKISVLKGDCFTRMLSMLNEFDEQLIREKFAVQQSQRSFKELGAKRREMNDRLQEVAAQEQEAKNIITAIRQAQKQRDAFCEQICEKVAEIESRKLQALQWNCLSFTKQFKPMEVRLDWRGLVQRRAVEVGFVSSKEFLENYKNTVYLQLNPHPQNQLLIEHKQSLAFKLSLSGLRENRHAQVFQLPPSLSLSLSLPSQNDTNQGYNGYFEFVQRIRNTIASAYLSEEELTPFYQFFKDSVRRRPIREVFLFYLYELGKTHSDMMPLACKEGKTVIRLLELFFTQCLKRYDSPIAIKALMLLYHLRLPDTDPISALRSHPLWSSFEFWETSFLMSVYEYFEVVVIYYHKLVESQAQQAGQGNWFTAILNIFPKAEPKKLSPHEALKEFYHQIIQNMSVIYLANMRMMGVPNRTVGKFKAYITQSVAKLNWSPELTQRLFTALNTTSNKSEANLLRLLTNEGILDRVMSKLLGRGENKKSVPLSKAISEWLQQK